jgi:hypothetical protein
VQLVLLAMLHKVPTMFANREFAEIGGLMSYGADVPDAWHQLGAYVGRILKGAKPAEPPGLAGEQVRADYQSPDRPDTRPDRAADPARAPTR